MLDARSVWKRGAETGNHRKKSSGAAEVVMAVENAAAAILNFSDRQMVMLW